MSESSENLKNDELNEPVITSLYIEIFCTSKNAECIVCILLQTYYVISLFTKSLFLKNMGPQNSHVIHYIYTYTG